MSSSRDWCCLLICIFLQVNDRHHFFFVQFGFCDEAWDDNPCLDFDYSGYHNSLIQ